MKKHLTWFLFIGYFAIFVAAGLIFYFFYFDHYLAMGSTPTQTAEVVVTNIYYSSGGKIYQIDPQYLKIGAQANPSEVVQGSSESVCPAKSSSFLIKDGNVYTKKTDQTDQAITTFSPPKAVIAFSLDRKSQTLAYQVSDSSTGISNIYISNATGGNLMQLTTDQTDTQPVISPDGTQVAYLKVGEGIYISPANQVQESKLLNTTATDLKLLCWR